MNKYFVILFLACLSALTALAQRKQPPPDAPVPAPARLVAIGRPVNGSILIRWAPDNDDAWMQANKYGYMLERYTIARDGKLLNKIERRKSNSIIKPPSLQRWDSIVRVNDYAAVIAEAIYGDSFDVSVTNKAEGTSFINKTEEAKQRYNMAMYSADHSFDAAAWGGLAWADRNVKTNERYLYRIFTLVPAKVRKIDTAFFYAGLEDTVNLPKAPELTAMFGDKSAMLNWDFGLHKQFYTSYYIERSDDNGKTFTKLTAQPVTNLSEVKNETGGESMLYMDSLATNETEYQYRICGFTLFGETGPYSDIIKGKGKAPLPMTPHITGYEPLSGGKYRMNWVIEDSITGLLQGFTINYSENADGPFRVIKAGISPETRSAEVESIASSGYYTVSALSKEGEERMSYASLLQPVDDTPPAIPKGLAAVIDSNGVVTVKWDANTEPDLLGYKLFVAYDLKDEFSIISDTAILQTEFRDTVSLKSRNRNLYYAVSALDIRANQSVMCKPVLVLKPDMIPPTQPVFASYESTEEAVKLEWINSSDTDVIVHKLYRKQMDGGGTGQWELQKEFTDKTIQTYSDKSFEPGRSYSYTIIAMDRSKLESDPASPLVISTQTKRVKEAIKKIDAVVDRESKAVTLFWEKAAGNIRQFELFRGDEKNPMSLYKVLEVTETSFVDIELLINTKYKYGIRAVYADGKYSDLKTKDVIY